MDSYQCMRRGWQPPSLAHGPGPVSGPSDLTVPVRLQALERVIA
jgi:hypothetical protein